MFGEGVTTLAFPVCSDQFGIPCCFLLALHSFLVLAVLYAPWRSFITVLLLSFFSTAVPKYSVASFFKYREPVRPFCV